jgi:Tat protein secretion system quality control protein TatD with DNase activity
VLRKLAEIYGVDEETVSAVTTANVERVFPLIVNKS